MKVGPVTLKKNFGWSLRLFIDKNVYSESYGISIEYFKFVYVKII